MIALAAALLVALLCLCFVLFVFFGLKRQSIGPQVPPRYYQTPAQRLGASIEELNLIFVQNTDYELLSARRELRLIRSELLRDRREIALICLAETRNDAHALWRFRRFLVRNGLRVTFQEEAGILVAFVVLLSCLTASRASVFCGPFFFPDSIRATAAAIQRFSRRYDSLVSRLPREKRLELEQKWSRELPAAALGL